MLSCAKFVDLLETYWVIFLHVNLLRTMLSILKFYFSWGRLFISTRTTFTLLNKSVAYREHTCYLQTAITVTAIIENGQSNNLH